jgi:mannose-1-phosphate guanylyltransferase/phosphomannomutase
VNVRYCVAAHPGVRRDRGTAGTLKLAQGMIGESFIVLPSDAVSDLDITYALNSHVSASAIATVRLNKVEHPGEHCLAECDEDGRLTRLANRPSEAEVFTDTASTGMCVFEPEALSCIPYDQAYDLERQLLPRLLNNRETVHGLHVPGCWRDLRDTPSFRAAHFDVLDGKLKIHLPAVRIDEGIWVGQAVDIDRSVELGSPLYLGEGVSARRDSTLGEYTVLGANTVVDENARTLRSIVGPGSFVGRQIDLVDYTIPAGHIAAETEADYERAVLQRGPVVSQLSYTEPDAVATLRTI